MNSRAETILLVEDESVTRAMVVRALRKAGYDVLEAGNLSEAVQQAMHCPPGKTMFIIDALLPGALGTEVAATLHGVHSDAPVLFLSGYAKEILDPHELEKNGASVLSRLITPEVLVRRVRQLLDGSLPSPQPLEA